MRDDASRRSLVLRSESVAAWIAPAETRAAAFAGDDRGIVAGRPREPVHRRNGLIVLDGHERIGDAREHAPGQRRGIIAFEHRHYGRRAVRDLHRMSRPGGLVDAGRARRIDNHERRPAVAEQQAKCAASAAAIPPTPACTNTCVGGSLSCRKASRAITV